MRQHGMQQSALQIVFKATSISKLLSAYPIIHGGDVSPTPRSNAWRASSAEPTSLVSTSDANKDSGHKAKAKDSSLKANAKAKDSSRKAKTKAKDLQKVSRPRPRTCNR